jgi:hypothetical protein
LHTQVKFKKPLSAKANFKSVNSLFKAEVKEMLAKDFEDSKMKIPAVSKKPTAVIDLSEGLPLQMSEEELTNVLLRQARTATEKATILDARDRLVRIKKESRSKSASDIKSVATLKGTCPDMCPEKERYLRVEKRRLASYEMVNQDKVVRILCNDSELFLFVI